MDVNLSKYSVIFLFYYICLDIILKIKRKDYAMKHLYYALLSVGVVLLVSGCSSDEATPEPLKRPKVHQVVDADLIVEENSTQASAEKLPYVYDNVDATRQKDLENNQDNGNYLNEQQEQSRAVAQALQLKRK